MGGWVGRLVAVAAGGLAALLMAGVAQAHTEVEVEPAVAGAANAVVTFAAEAESPSSGIASVRVVLPAGAHPDGIPPAEVTLVSAPTGWTLRPTADGYVV